MSNLLRGTPATAAAVVVTAAPSANEGIDLTTLRGSSGNTLYGPRLAYFRVRGAAGNVTLAADGAELYVKRGTQWEASGLFRGGKAITVTTAIWASDFLQAIGDAERITLHVPAAGGALDMECGFYEESL